MGGRFTGNSSNWRRLDSLTGLAIISMGGSKHCGCRVIRAYSGVMEAVMAIRQAGAARGADGGEHWPAAVASLIVGTAFLALWFWLLPSWLGFHVDMEGAARW